MRNLDIIKTAGDWTPVELREWRARLGWTQANAADALRMNMNAYRNIECGSRRVRRQLQHFAEILETLHKAGLGPNGRPL